METQVRLNTGGKARRSPWLPRTTGEPWRRTEKRDEKTPREPTAPWAVPQQRRGPGDGEPDGGFQGIEALQRYIEARRKEAERSRKERERKGRERRRERDPEIARTPTEQLRRVIPTAVRAAPWFGAWWCVEVQINATNTWWPVTGTATSDPDRAERTALRIRNGAVPVMSDRQGTLTVEDVRG